jgi:hypothetical protein
VDGDGDVDVLSASANDTRLPGMRITDQRVSQLIPLPPMLMGLSLSMRIDVDKDGDIDVLSAHTMMIRSHGMRIMVPRVLPLIPLPPALIMLTMSMR